MLLWGKQKYQVTNIGMKSKIVMFAGQRIINLTHFLPNLAWSYSVASNDRSFFGFNIQRNPFKQPNAWKAVLIL